MPTPKEDSDHQVQKVKLFEIVPVEVTGIKMLGDNKKAIVKYKLKYENVTPFIALTKYDLNKPGEKTAYFSLYDDGWKLEDKPGLEFLVN